MFFSLSLSSSSAVFESSHNKDRYGVGLELTFSPSWSMEGSEGCGVVLCEESDKQTNSTRVEDARFDSLDFILEMLLFKHDRQSTPNVGAGLDLGKKRLIAALTLYTPRLSHESIEVKVKGQLTPSGAEMRVGFYNLDDCEAEVTCEVTMSNNHKFSSHLARRELILRSCERNKKSFLPHPFFPYPVIVPNKDSPFHFPHLCDTDTDHGGWIVIQRRSSGKVNFFRNWNDYKNGFGSLQDDFWLGNEKIYTITNSATYELLVTLTFRGVNETAHYSSFSVSDERSNFFLHLGAYSGTAGGSLYFHRGIQFSTKDRDNDNSKWSCAVDCKGGWWYNSCHSSNLNGKWGAGNDIGPIWVTLTNHEPTTFTEMKIRRVDKQETR